MNPVAFTIGNLDIRWYGILISLGIICGMILALREVKKQGINEDKFLDLILIVIPCSIIGARIYYVIFNWDYYRGDIFAIINIRGGGLAIHGGLLTAFVLGYFICRIKKLDFYKISDIASPCIALGQSIGRWGNYINKEAFGSHTDLPWGILVNGDRVHPTFFYESIWDFGLFLFLMKFRKKKKYEGQLFVLYIITYSIGRFFIEGLRTDSLMLGPLKAAQIISIIGISIGIILNMYLKKRNIVFRRN